MDLKGYITKGIGEAGTLTALAKQIGVMREALTASNGGKRGLPGYACVRLAQLIGEDERRVIAASELVTEKNPERRAVWLPFVQEIAQSVRTQAVRKVQSSIL